jgi:hypothetical protein
MPEEAPAACRDQPQRGGLYDFMRRVLTTDHGGQL